MKKLALLLALAVGVKSYAQNKTMDASTQVKIANGVVQGVAEASGVRSFKGIPFAQPPVGELRWHEPLPPKNWSGVRLADHFAAKAMQRPIYSDMIFRNSGTSEDCLYLNVWTPAKQGNEKLPVLVYFFGGGFMAGDGSEGRYDGEGLAKRGIVTVTITYRLGIFGFMAHPELTQESAHQSSGNYGLMDQHAALLWVQKNIVAFGGDPKRVTIAGESAGSMSVSGQLASPLSKNLFVGAIGESGALLANLSPIPLAQAEQNGQAFATKIGAKSLAELRKLPADSLLSLSANTRFGCDVDGYFLPEAPEVIFAAGKQMHVPLLAGWNTAESNYHAIMVNDALTMENYKAALNRLYPGKADEVFKLYPGNSESEIKQSATELASDRFIAFATWKMIDMQAKTSGKPVYRYLFARSRPALSTDKEPSSGAVHSAEIEYALGNLPYNKTYNWTADDYRVSELMQQYFANFIKTGNPNGAQLPNWNKVDGPSPLKVMVINATSEAQSDKTSERYLFLTESLKL